MGVRHGLYTPAKNEDSMLSNCGCLRRILDITWQDYVQNKNVLAQAGIPSMFALLTQRHLCWLGHISYMLDGQIQKHMLYGKLATGSRPAGKPFLCCKDICKQVLKAGNINPAGWEAVAADGSRWRPVMKAGIQMTEQRGEDQWEVIRECRQQRAASANHRTRCRLHLQ